MNIGCYIVTDGKLKNIVIPEELLTELVKSLRTKGKEIVHFASGSIEVEGIYIPAKGTRNSIMLLPDVED